MTYTIDQAIALMRESGAAVDYHRPTDMAAYTFWEEELTAFANKVREQTLLEAAEVCRNVSQNRKDSEASARSGAFECSIAILNISEGK